MDEALRRVWAGQLDAAAAQVQAGGGGGVPLLHYEDTTGKDKTARVGARFGAGGANAVFTTRSIFSSECWHAFFATLVVRAMVGLFYVGGQFAVEHTVANWATMGTLYVTLMATFSGGLDMFLLYMGVFSGITMNVMGLLTGKTTWLVAMWAVIGSYAGETLGILVLRPGLLSAVADVPVRGLDGSLWRLVPIAACHGLLYACVFFVLRPVDMGENAKHHRDGGGATLAEHRRHVLEGRSIRPLFAGALLALGHGLFVLLWDGIHTPIFDTISLLALMTAIGHGFTRWWAPVVYNAAGTCLAYVLYVIFTRLYPEVVLEGELDAEIGGSGAGAEMGQHSFALAHLPGTVAPPIGDTLLHRKPPAPGLAATQFYAPSSRPPSHGWSPGK